MVAIAFVSTGVSMSAVGGAAPRLVVDWWLGYIKALRRSWETASSDKSKCGDFGRTFWNGGGRPCSQRSFFAVVIDEWEVEFGLRRTVVSAARGLSFIAQAITTPLCGHVVDTFGGRTAIPAFTFIVGLVLCFHVFLEGPATVIAVFGILGGFAYGLVNYNILVAAVMQLLPRRQHGIASGVCIAGSPLGQMLLVPGFEAILRRHGWRVGYAACGVVLLALVPALWAVFPRDARRGDDKSAATGDAQGTGGDNRDGDDASEGRGRGKSGFEELELDMRMPDDAVCSEGDELGGEQGRQHVQEKEPTSPVPPQRAPMRQTLWRFASSGMFWQLGAIMVVCGITAVGYGESHLVVFFEEQGFPAATAARAFGVVHLFNGVGLVLSGAVVDRGPKASLLAFIFSTRAATMAAMLRMRGSPAALYTLSTVFGVVDYSIVPPTSALIATHFGRDVLGLGFGLQLGLHSLGSSIGSVAGGYMHDILGDYFAAMWGCVGLCGVATCIALNIVRRGNLASK